MVGMVILSSPMPRYAHRPHDNRPHDNRPQDIGPQIALPTTAAFGDSLRQRSTSSVEEAQQRLILRFLRQAPFLPAASDLGITSCPVKPWPHQLRVVRQATARFPESFLFADEVGLGKTIEAGLVLRQLLISGRVHRALLLVPKGILRQWQEELYEKLVLDVPRYEEGRFVDVHGREVVAQTADDNPWNRLPLILASSQLAKQRRRRREMLEAEPWDVVLVDEAHHARRRASGSGPPNLLLELLAGGRGQPGLKDRCRCLYLLSATPMQVHAVELWELLRLLGMGGRWGSGEDAFSKYFEELRRPFGERDWGLVMAMAGEVVDDLGGLDAAFEQWARQTLGSDAGAVEGILLAAGGLGTGPETASAADLTQLSPGQQRVLDQGLRRHTPLRCLAWRHTRGLLRAYRRAGLIDTAVPRRRTQNVWIALSPQERQLYDRIEGFVGELFQRYEARRKGLGFAMTLYRRRLTSSFYAVRCSLERRLKLLCHATVEAPQPELLDDEDGAWDEIFGDDPPSDEAWSPSLFDDQPLCFDDERGHLEDFVDQLRRMDSDSKLLQLENDLQQLLPQRDRVLVFTQYTDTMDFLRRRLVAVHGVRLACYSGRGGEMWRADEGWQSCSKEHLRERFRRGDIEVLLCTEAAGEGLNLQTCGVLINFDMPWNPMRVEQRIGRIDRIGQLHDEVWIRNYFYRDTVEAEIYRRLSDRIDEFEEVVGTLQPILHNVSETIRRLAMVPESRRADLMRHEMQRLDDGGASGEEPSLALSECFAQQADALDLDARRVDDMDPILPSPVAPSDLQRCLTTTPLIDAQWTPAAHLDGAYELTWRGARHLVTFEPSVFERYPYKVSLLTYGQPLLDDLLASVEQQSERDVPRGVGLYSAREPSPVSLFFVPRAEGMATLESLADLQAVMEDGAGDWIADQEGAASVLFSRRRRQALAQQTRVEQRRRRGQRSALVESARSVLQRACQVEQALARRPGLFETPPPLAAGVAALESLARHGPPWAPLLRLLGEQRAAAVWDEAHQRRLEGLSRGRLDMLWQELATTANRLQADVESLERRIVAAEMAVSGPSAGGSLERLWFPVDRQDSVASVGHLGFLAADEVRPFVDGVPFYEDLQALVERLRDLDGDPQREERQRPTDFRWLPLSGRHRARPGLCVVPISLPSMSRSVPMGSWCLLRLAPAGPWDNKLLLLEHPEIDDPDLGGSWTLRRYQSQQRTYEDGSWQALRVILSAVSPNNDIATQVLEEVEESTIWVIAELLEVLSDGN